MGSATRKIANAFSTSGIIQSANINNASLDNITTIAGAGDMVLVSSATASSSASIEFSLGDYKEYKFFWVNCHPANNQVDFQINFSTDNGSNYNVTKTTTVFDAYHYENDSDNNLQYITSRDLAQSTSNAMIDFCSNENDQSTSGILKLFNPSSTTYVKHFISVGNDAWLDVPHPVTQNVYVAGYANTTSALTNIRFTFSSGNIDAGKILMFGVN